MNHVKYSGLHLFLIFLKFFFFLLLMIFFIYMNNYQFILLDNSMIFFNLYFNFFFKITCTAKVFFKEKFPSRGSNSVINIRCDHSSI